MTIRLGRRSVKVVQKLVVVIGLGIVLVTAGAAAVLAATPVQVIQTNRAAAVTAADRLLGAVVLPAGSTPVGTEPAGDEYQLAHSLDLAVYAAEVGRHGFWTTSAPPSAVIASVKAHLPAGAKSSGSGSSYDNRTETGVFASYSLPAIGAPALGPRSLTVDAVKLADGSTGVRADADVRYSAPRLPSQRVPPQARVLEITRPKFGSSPALALTVTNRADVRRIAAIVDGLPFVAPLTGVAFSCPAIYFAPLETFTFRASPAGPVLAEVTEMSNEPSGADPCFTASLTLRGHHEPHLLDGRKLLRQAGSILGVTLTAP